jgi:hypothetical protein
VNRTPIVRVVLNNGFFLSLVYLVLGVASELLWRYHPMHWVYRLSFMLDALPAQTLDLFGLLRPLQLGYAYGRVSELRLRWIFAGTSIAVIFGTAFVIGALMAATRKFWDRPVA